MEPFWVGPGPDGSVRVARQRLRLWNNPAWKRSDRRNATKQVARDVEERDARFRGLDTIRCIEIATRSPQPHGPYTLSRHTYFVVAEDGRHSEWRTIAHQTDETVLAFIVKELGLS